MRTPLSYSHLDPETLLTVFPHTTQPGRPPLARNTFASVDECLPTASAFFPSYFLPPLVSKPLPHIHLRRHPFLFSPPSPLHWMEARGVSPLPTLLPIVSDRPYNPGAVLIRPFEHI